MILIVAFALHLQAGQAPAPIDDSCLSNFEIPCVRVMPQFPTTQMHLHLRVPPEGVSVQVFFNVLDDGSTEVTGSTTPEGLTMFERASERAVSQWLYAAGHPRQRAETTLIYRMTD